MGPGRIDMFFSSIQKGHPLMQQRVPFFLKAVRIVAGFPPKDMSAKEAEA